jgi:7-carboxy-7-deazaguanine synthase (Cx14CxxC type)
LAYTVKEIFHSVQGEGANSGTSAVFVRFAGCNLWSGREEDRETAICRFCDTDFVGGNRMTLGEIRDAVGGFAAPLVIFTGGEPALHLDKRLVDSIRDLGRTVAVETNGTRPLPDVDWICVSPKVGTDVVVRAADELKLVYPQEGLSPATVGNLIDARFKWLSPMDGPNLRTNIELAFAYVQQHPEWRLNIQAHKFWNVR